MLKSWGSSDSINVQKILRVAWPLATGFGSLGGPLCHGGDRATEHIFNVRALDGWRRLRMLPKQKRQAVIDDNKRPRC